MVKVDVFAFATMVWEVLPVSWLAATPNSMYQALEPPVDEVVSVEIPHANLDPADIAHRIQTKVLPGLVLCCNYGGIVALCITY